MTQTSPLGAEVVEGGIPLSLSQGPHFGPSNVFFARSSFFVLKYLIWW